MFLLCNYQLSDMFRLYRAIIRLYKIMVIRQGTYSNFYRCTVHFEIYAVHKPTNALYVKLVKSSKFTLKYTIISLIHVSVFNDYHQGALYVPN